MITYHRADASQAEEIKKLLLVTWNQAYENIFTNKQIDAITSQWHSIELLQKQIEEEDTHFYIAKKEGKILGMCNASYVSGKEIVNIQRLHVLPESQRQGIATRLMDTVTASFPGVSKVEIEVEKKNQRAVSFYKKYGFRDFSKKILEVKGIKIPCVVMQKTVNAGLKY